SARPIRISGSLRSPPVRGLRARDSVTVPVVAVAGRLPATAASLSGNPLRRQPLGGRPADVIAPAQRLEEPDDGGADVDLPLEHAVPGAGRVGVVEVVPGLAEGRDGQPPDVPRLVADLELLLAEDVADRVDRPGDVVEQADAYERAP